MTDKVIKIVGAIATGVGIAATCVSNYVADKKLDQKVSEQVTKALAEKK